MEDKSLEEVFQELEEVTGKLEGGEVSLEESFALYHRGIDLLKQCNDKIDTVEKQMIVLDESAE